MSLGRLNLRTYIAGKIPPLGRRGRVLMWGIILSFLCGIIQFGEPLEDIIKGGRDYIRQQDYRGNVVVVGIDDKTAKQFGGLNYSREVDARVIDNLFKMGAKRIFYDKVFADAGDPKGDEALREALIRHRGKVFFGVAELPDPITQKIGVLKPNEAFRDLVETTSLIGKSTPFGFSAIFPYQSNVDGEFIPSMSYAMSETAKSNAELFRPDWSINARTVTTLSLADVHTDIAYKSTVSGHDILIGPNSSASGDIHRIILQGLIPGLYFHVIAAETLRNGTPQNWGWALMWAVAVILAVFVVFAQKRRDILAIYTIAALTIGVLPLFLDSILITIDVVPAALLFSIAAIRGAAIRRSEFGTGFNLISGLPNFARLRRNIPQRKSTLIALKIRNYAAIVAGFGAEIEPALVAEVMRRSALTNPNEVIYHDGDTLLWFADIDSNISFSNHLEGLSRLITATMQLQGRPFDLLISFGVDADHDSKISVRIGSAMLCAQEASQENKIWKFYDPERRHESSWELSLLDSMTQAIDNGDIWVAYQSKADLKTGKIIGAEALARWSHPERGTVTPELFIDVAERNNRIDQITALVLDHAIGTAAIINRDFGTFNMAVNISVQMLDHPDLLSMISGALVRHGLRPERLTLEITETSKLPQNEKTIELLRRIVAEGITLSLDDYGTGNATLDYLKLLPFSEVKIDRSFISNITQTEQDLILVEATITMAHSLGCKVVGEGVETEEIRMILANLGCDIAQGFHIGYPVRQTAYIQTLIDQGVKRIA